MPRTLPDKYHIPPGWLAAWAVRRGPEGRALVWAAPPRAGVRLTTTDTSIVGYVCPRRPRPELVAADRVFRFDCTREPEPEEDDLDSVESVHSEPYWAPLLPDDASEIALRDTFAPPVEALLRGLGAGTRDPSSARAELAAALAYLGLSPRMAIVGVVARRGLGWDVGHWRYDRRPGRHRAERGLASVGPWPPPRPDRFDPLLGAVVRDDWASSGSGASALLDAISGAGASDEPEAVASRPVAMVRLGRPGGGFATGDVAWTGASFGGRDVVVFPLSPRACLVFSGGEPLVVPADEEEAFCAEVNAAIVAGSNERVVFRPGAPGTEGLGAPAGGWEAGGLSAAPDEGDLR